MAPKSKNSPNKKSRNVLDIGVKLKILSLLEAMGQDPIMTRSMEFKHACNLALTIYEDLYRD